MYIKSSIECFKFNLSVDFSKKAPSLEGALLMKHTFLESQPKRAVLNVGLLVFPLPEIPSSNVISIDFESIDHYGRI